MVVVTDIERKLKNGEIKPGYYMDGWLMENLDEVPVFLKKSYDAVLIVSGHGKVRIGKSTLALQMAYYIAWKLAGGNVEIVERAGKGKAIKTKITKPIKPVRFNLDHVVFSPDDLMKVAESLPPNSVIVYDEGRAGLDSARAMQNINKTMEDFFQECGQYGHVIIIVLPNFFKLHEDYAVTRSLFLVDVYADENYDRGYFSFYNEVRKEWLYVFGKKTIGVGSKYSATKANFFGKFGSFVPIDKEAYEEKKKTALRKKRKQKKEIRWKKFLATSTYLLSEISSWSGKEIAEEMERKSGNKISRQSVDLLIKDGEKLMKVNELAGAL